jgi:hypothetical protein
MLNYWIFVVRDAKIGKEKRKGIEIHNQRMSDNFWGIGERTPYGSSLAGIWFLASRQECFGGVICFDREALD